MTKLNEGDFRATHPNLKDERLSPATGHPAANMMLLGPAENVGDLECEITEEEGHSLSLSRWIVSEEQRDMIVAGGHLRLEIFQHPMPPVAIAVEGPPCPACGHGMVWDERLRTFVCEHREDDEPEVMGSAVPGTSEVATA